MSAGTPKTRLMTPAGTPASASARKNAAGEAGAFLRPLDDDRTAGRQRRAELAGDLVDREIPRREGRDRADRLFQHEIGDVRRACRHDTAISAPRLLREPVERIGGNGNFDSGFLDRLALFARHDPRDGLDLLAQDRRRAMQNLAALEGRRRTPECEAARGGGDRGLKIGDLGPGDLADDRFSRRIDDFERAPASAGPPGAVDKKPNVKVLRVIS